MAVPAAPPNPLSAQAVARKQWEHLFRAGNATACVNILDSLLLEEDGVAAIAQWCLEVIIEPNVERQLADGAGNMLQRLQPVMARALSRIKAQDYLSRFVRRLSTCVQKRLSRLVRLLTCILHAINTAVRDPVQACVAESNAACMPSVAREVVNLWRVSTPSTSRVLLAREACREAANLLANVCERQQRALESVANVLADELTREEQSKLVEMLPAGRLQQCLLVHLCTNSRINSALILQHVAHLASAHILDQRERVHAATARSSDAAALPELPCGLRDSFPRSPLAEVVQLLHL